MQTISPAAKWHLNRAKKMLKRHSHLLKNYQNKRSFTYFLMIPLLFVVQTGIAVSCQNLGFFTVLLLSATIGSYIAWGCHHLLHELTHKTVLYSQYRFMQHILMKLCTLTYPDLSLFSYYRWHHMPHHSKLAGNSTQEVLLAQRVDADVLAVGEYYAVKRNKNALPTAKNNHKFKASPYKLMIGLTALTEFFINWGVFLRHMALIFHTWLKPSAYPGRDVEQLLKARISIFIHFIFIACFLGGLFVLTNAHSLLYLLMSFLFIKGFLFHPYILFWLTEHKTTQHQNFCQPTTSIYHWITDIIFWNLNYHVEHHDFPSVSGKYLKKIHRTCAKDYNELFSFSSLMDAYGQFFKTNEAWVYGCQSLKSMPEQVPFEKRDGKTISNVAITS